MKRFGFLSLLALLFALGLAQIATADTVVPAGTLLRCTLDEPNFSSKTVAVGDPVVCHLSSITEFGHVAFPRGAYLGGHLEAYKDPGHFVGKGYLQIQFDRIGLPDVDLQVPAKVIGVRDYKVDRDGKIDGHGHPERDIVEWLIPPLWPWKVITLPARGPRPVLKGESQLTLRLMDDIAVPQPILPGWHTFGSGASLKPQIYPGTNARPLIPAGERYAATQSSPAPAANQNAASPAAVNSEISGPRVILASQTSVMQPIASVTPVLPVSKEQAAQFTLIAMKSDIIYAVSDYYLLANGRLAYSLTNGGAGVVDPIDIDWDRTNQLNSSRGVQVVLKQRNGN